MKRIVTMVCVMAAGASLASPITFTYDMTGMAGLNGDTADYTQNPSSISVGANSKQLVSADGVPAPVAIGDSVSASSTFKLSTGATEFTAANNYAFTIGMAAGNWRQATGTATSFSRRNNTIMGANISGDLWVFDGWQNMSQFGLAPTNSTSDWITGEITITKAATGYDIVTSWKNGAGTEIHSSGSTGQALATLAAADTWYLKVGTDWQFQSAQFSEAEIDAASITSSIPEPGTLGLIGAASIGALFIRRRFMMQ